MDLCLTRQHQCCKFRNMRLTVVTPEVVGSLPAGLSLHKQIPSHQLLPLTGRPRLRIAASLSVQQCPEPCQPLGAGEQLGLKGLKKETVAVPGRKVRLQNCFVTCPSVAGHVQHPFCHAKGCMFLYSAVVWGLQGSCGIQGRNQSWCRPAGAFLSMPQ